MLNTQSYLSERRHTGLLSYTDTVFATNTKCQISYDNMLTFLTNISSWGTIIRFDTILPIVSRHDVLLMLEKAISAHTFDVDVPQMAQLYEMSMKLFTGFIQNIAAEDMSQSTRSSEHPHIGTTLQMLPQTDLALTIQRMSAAGGDSRVLLYSMWDDAYGKQHLGACCNMAMNMAAKNETTFEAILTGNETNEWQMPTASLWFINQLILLRPTNTGEIDRLATCAQQEHSYGSLLAAHIKTLTPEQLTDNRLVVDLMVRVKNIFAFDLIERYINYKRDCSATTDELTLATRRVRTTLFLNKTWQHSPTLIALMNNLETITDVCGVSSSERTSYFELLDGRDIDVLMNKYVNTPVEQLEKEGTRTNHILVSMLALDESLRAYFPLSIGEFVSYHLFALSFFINLQNIDANQTNLTFKHILSMLLVDCTTDLLTERVWKSEQSSTFVATVLGDFKKAILPTIGQPPTSTKSPNVAQFEHKVAEFVQNYKVATLDTTYVNFLTTLNFPRKERMRYTLKSLAMHINSNAKSDTPLNPDTFAERIMNGMEAVINAKFVKGGNPVLYDNVDILMVYLTELQKNKVLFKDFNLEPILSILKDSVID